ncbi:unnamed protein product [Ectocarpus sp. 4 AP-2014]
MEACRRLLPRAQIFHYQCPHLFVLAYNAVRASCVRLAGVVDQTSLSHGRSTTVPSTRTLVSLLLKARAHTHCIGCSLYGVPRDIVPHIRRTQISVSPAKTGKRSSANRLGSTTPVRKNTQRTAVSARK